MDIVVTPFDASDEQAAHEALAVMAAARRARPARLPACVPGQLHRRAQPSVAGQPVGARGGLPRRRARSATSTSGCRSWTTSKTPTCDQRRPRPPPAWGRRRPLPLGGGAGPGQRPQEVLAMTVQTLPGGPERDDAGVRFAASRRLQAGAGRGPPPARRDRARPARARPHARRRVGQGRRLPLVRWIDLAPDELLDDVAYLDSRLLLDAPMGDLDWEPQKIDADRIRAQRRGRDQRAGRAQYHTGAVHEETGRLVAWTTLDTGATSKWHSFQNITIVEPRHRGHRLGAIVKVENLRCSSPSSRRSPRSTPGTPRSTTT